jgi:hypothetical protein
MLAKLLVRKGCVYFYQRNAGDIWLPLNQYGEAINDCCDVSTDYILLKLRDKTAELVDEPYKFEEKTFSWFEIQNKPGYYRIVHEKYHNSYVIINRHLKAFITGPDYKLCDIGLQNLDNSLANSYRYIPVTEFKVTF